MTYTLDQIASACVAAGIADSLYERLSSHLADVPATPALPPMNDELLDILGRPNFRCGSVAERLRRKGWTIEHRAEHEQAVVIHWLLGLYLEHGTSWADKGADYLVKP